MKHLLLIAAVCVSSAVANAQTTRVYAKHLQASEKLQLKTRTITDFTISLFTTDSSSDTKIPTAKAVADFVRARAGGGGGGAVSSVFGRSGAVVANAGDYSAFYANLSHTHPLSDLLQSGASLGQVPVWTISGWQPGTVSGGGGSADSSWNSTETGIQPNILGVVSNPSFASLPSGWVDNTPAATVTVSGNKIAVSGGNTDIGALAGEGTGSAYNNRIETDSAQNYNLMYYNFRFVPKDKTSASKLAFTFFPNAFFFSASTEFYFNLTDNADSSGAMYVRSVGSTTVQAKTQKLPFSVGDSLEVFIHINNWEVGVVYKNRTTGNVVRTYFTTPSPLGSGGKSYFALLGGSQDITHYNVKVFNESRTDGVTILGDSQFAGNGATSFERSVYGMLNRGTGGRITNISNNSTTLEKAARWSLPNALKLSNQTIIIALGYNDRRDLVTDTNTFRQRLDTLAFRSIRAGKTVILATLIPAGGVSNNFNVCIRNLATSRGLRTIPIDSVVQLRANMFSADNIHWSDSAQLLAYNKIIERVPEIDALFRNDTTSFAKYYNLPVGTENMENVVVDKEGNVYKYPAKKYDIIQNAYNRNGRGTFAQEKAEIHIAGPLRSDSALLITNRNGAYIGFAGGTPYDTTSTGSNFYASNAGASGSGFPQQFGNLAQNGRNFVLQQVSIRPNKGGAGPINVLGGTNWIHAYVGGNVTGDGNYVSQGSSNFQLSSGSYNWLSGLEGGGAFTTGSYNMSWTNRINYNGGSSSWAANNATGTMMWGTPYDYNGGTLMQNGEVLIASYTRGDRLYTFGPRGAFAGTKVTWWPGHQAGTNLAGLPLEIGAMPGTGTGLPGVIKFLFAPAGSTGTAVNTNSFTGVQLEHTASKFFNRFQTAQGSDVSSANDLTLPSNGITFRVTGTTQINAITTTNWQDGSEITLLFTSSLVVKNNTAGGGSTAVIKLEGGVDFAATADDTLMLKLISGVWYQVGKSIN